MIDENRVHDILKAFYTGEVIEVFDYRCGWGTPRLQGLELILDIINSPKSYRIRPKLKTYKTRTFAYYDKNNDVAFNVLTDENKNIDKDAVEFIYGKKFIKWVGEVVEVEIEEENI